MQDGFAIGIYFPFVRVAPHLALPCQPSTAYVFDLEFPNRYLTLREPGFSSFLAN